MQKIKLGKSWNKHRKGETVAVDDLRAEWLRVKGYEEDKEKKKKKEKK